MLECASSSLQGKSEHYNTTCGVVWTTPSRSVQRIFPKFTLTRRQKGGYNPIYRCTHHDGKARVGDWMRAQPSVVSDDNMSWSILTTMVYMEMLNTVRSNVRIFVPPS